MRIGERSQHTGIPVRTIRYYEQIGLLPEPERAESGYHHFDNQHVQLARFIRRARGLGFSLQQIREIIGAGDASLPCATVRSVVLRNLHTIDQHLADLMAMRDVLSRTLDELDTAESVAADQTVCPVVESRPANEPVFSLDSPVKWKV